MNYGQELKRKNKGKIMKTGISGQYGEPKASKIFWPLQKKYNDCLKKYVNNSYFNNLKLFSIIFRVSGNLQDFKSEGAERLKYITKESELTIDLTFTEKSWKGIPINEIKNNIALGVDECLEQLINKAKEIENQIDLELLKNDLLKARACFLGE